MKKLAENEGLRDPLTTLFKEEEEACRGRRTLSTPDATGSII